MKRCRHVTTQSCRNITKQHGRQHLVTAAGSNVNGCGYTLTYDADTAATWAAAFAN